MDATSPDISTARTSRSGAQEEVGPAGRESGRANDACGAITIGIDGRLYCHDLTPDLVAVLLELCPTDQVLMARAALNQGATHV
jgi:hypothetical protein